MAISFKAAETDRLERQVAALTGNSPTEAVCRFLSDVVVIDELMARFDALPILDERSADEIIGYDAHGVPG